MRSSEYPPFRCTKGHWEQSFRVWAHDPTYLEDRKPWKCVAAFRYLTEALDYIAALQDRGVTVIFQTPAYVSEIRPEDKRVVYREGICS